MTFITPYWTTKSFNSNLWREMDKIFDGYTSAEPSEERDFAPAFESAENEKSFFLSLDLPGLKKDEIKIEVADGSLRISGERKRGKSVAEQKSAQKYERSYGKFTKTFTLPKSVAADKIEAHYEDGVLDLWLPKAEAAKAKTIEIQVGKKSGIFDKLVGSAHSPENSEFQQS